MKYCFKYSDLRIVRNQECQSIQEAIQKARSMSNGARFIVREEVVREFAVVDTEDELVLAVQYDSGKVEIEYERRKIDDKHVEIIQHHNVDRNGDYYKTRRVVEIS